MEEPVKESVTSPYKVTPWAKENAVRERRYIETRIPFICLYFGLWSMADS
jgi:hypothetical protein